ncbi:MAG TPA: LemA family protein [Acidimicrobiia bacterium]|nr:LemA family protein [Acidimicrobiia bacterium]
MAQLFARGRPRWLIPVAIVVGVVLLMILPLVGTYNSLVDKETAVDQSFADLDAQLQRRHDLIPNLVNAVQGVLGQEQRIFGEIARARSRYAGATSTEDRLEASEAEQSALARLLVIVENYPQLRSSENVRDLQVQLEGTENRIAQARRDYNGSVTDYNRSIRRFPRNLIAGIFGFDKRVLFETAPEDRDAPTVDLENDPLPSDTSP